eukprot:TRINITY_DN13083_c0_g6_i1.p1 TRINITY_DN13083_c0_g6~~TRINITY_DN13083_c0_g6_i1.p1  ORF type:complete len:509 (+),score=30.74 TRINITY_DN13083_c0_g6_i1:57-1583(+)
MSAMELSSSLTALAAAFPEFQEGDAHSICFNIESGDANVHSTDLVPVWHWQGTYFEFTKDGPVDPKWSEHLSKIADPKGVERAKQFCQTITDPTMRVFYSPGKAKRWGAGLSPTSKTTKADNLLLRRLCKGLTLTAQWSLVELPWEDDTVSRRPLIGNILSRITYPHLTLRRGAILPPIQKDFISGAGSLAWVAGSTLIRKEEDLLPGKACHLIDAVPWFASPVCFTNLQQRAPFMGLLAKLPTCVVTGATAARGSPYSSPLATEVAKSVGFAIADVAATIGICHAASASMRGFEGTMSVDSDFTEGFAQHHGCDAIHFKGSNAVWLHGNGWKVSHGSSYLLEEESSDFSNTAKEACLMACATGENCLAVLANGGPTVASNLARFLYLGKPNRVFTIAGMHTASGGSGASGAFARTKDQLSQAILTLKDLCPSFFDPLIEDTADEIVARLQQKPLILLSATEPTIDTFVMRPDVKNTKMHRGLTDARAVHPYADQCRAAIMSILTSQR